MIIFCQQNILNFADEESGSKKKFTEKEPPILKETNFIELRKSVQWSDYPDEALEKSFLIRRQFLKAKHKFELKEYIDAVEL